jgi:hypothetical protein
MRNVEEVFSKRPVFKVRLQGAPPPRGWTVRYKSGIEERYEVHSGDLLSQWSADSEGVTFNFSRDRHDMVIFDTEAEVVKIVEWLRQNAAVETEALKIGS